MDIFFLCFSLVEKAKVNQELHNDLNVLDCIWIGPLRICKHM